MTALENLVVKKEPPPNRVGTCTGGLEHHLPEGAVMVAYAMHLFRTANPSRIEIHPDGEHGKRFNFRPWLEQEGFSFSIGSGRTDYSGIYKAADGRELELTLQAGKGDVVARCAAGDIVAECKGGVLNSKHAGQLSRLRSGLCEAVGLLLASSLAVGVRQVAVVPHTPATLRLAERMAARASVAGISLSLVDGDGQVVDVSAQPLAGPATDVIERMEAEIEADRQKRKP